MLDAGCADSHPFYLAVNDGSNTLQVWIPSAVGDVVCVANVVSIDRFFSADLADFCHLVLQDFNQFNSLKPFFQDWKSVFVSWIMALCEIGQTSFAKGKGSDVCKGVNFYVETPRAQWYIFRQRFTITISLHYHNQRAIR